MWFKFVCFFNLGVRGEDQTKDYLCVIGLDIAVKLEVGTADKFFLTAVLFMHLVMCKLKERRENCGFNKQLTHKLDHRWPATTLFSKKMQVILVLVALFLRALCWSSSSGLCAKLG